MDDLPARTVLVVEEMALISLSVEDELRDAGFEVAGPFSTGTAALEYLRLNPTAPYAAVVSMGSGASFLPLIRALQDLGIPPIVHSGFRGDDVPELADLTWIEKPAAMGEVARAVQALAAGELPVMIDPAV